MEIKIGSVYQMTGEFDKFEKYEAVRVVAIRRDQEKLKFVVVSSGEEYTATCNNFKNHFINVEEI